VKLIAPFWPSRFPIQALPLRRPGLGADPWSGGARGCRRTQGWRQDQMIGLSRAVENHDGRLPGVGLGPQGDLVPIPVGNHRGVERFLAAR